MGEDIATQPVWGPDGSLVTGQPSDDEPVMTENLHDGPHDECNIAEPHTHLEEEAADEDAYDPADYLTPQEIRNGGAYRKDDKYRRYWLNIPQLVEFTRMDDSFSEEEEAEFWAWFRDFIEVNKIRPVAGDPTPMKQKRGIVTPQWNDYWDKSKSTASKGKTYLSDWWGGSTYYGSYSYSGGTVTEKARKLTVALQAVQSTVRVIDNNVKRMRVQFSQDAGGAAPRSYTSYDERIISVSPTAILDSKIADGLAIDITTGFALHEGSHAEYSEPSLGALKQPSELRPLAVSGLLHNLFEDMRIEMLTAREFPGFQGYFDTALEYLWQFVEQHAPKTWGPDIEAKMNAIIAGVKWSTKYKEFAEDDSADLATEMQWWRDLVSRYQTADITMRQALEMAMARLAEDEETKKQMQEMAADEKAAQDAGTMAIPMKDLPKSVRDAIERAFGGKVIDICPSPDHSLQKEGPTDKKLDAKTGEMVNRLAKEEWQQTDSKELKIPELGNQHPEFVTLHPVEDTNTKAQWTPPLRGLVARMRNAFFFRPVAQQWTTRLQRSGALDEDQVWSAAPLLGKDRDFRVFEQKNIESSPDTTITLLVDISGSMSGEKVRTAVQAAAIMHEVLKSTPGVRVRVRAHTGDVDPVTSGQIVIYKIWESGEPISRLGIPFTLRMGNNYDGYAIGWCVREMLLHQKPEEQRLLIVLSDGLPHGARYGGVQAMQHVKETQAWARKQGVDVIQVAIDPYMDPARQAQMFDNWVAFTSLEALPAQLTNILKKAIK